MNDQPIDNVEWVDPATLTANDYNPNRVAPPEMRLLKVSLLEDGWTQPLVAREDGELVDGFHRWTLGSKDAEVRALTGGLVPVVRLRAADDPSHQRMSTIRHNRARGNHYVVKMADIVGDLVANGMDDDEIGRLLGMDHEEVIRLKERGHMPTRGGLGGFSDAWKPSLKEEGMSEFGVKGRTERTRARAEAEQQPT